MDQHCNILLHRTSKINYIRLNGDHPPKQIYLKPYLEESFCKCNEEIKKKEIQNEIVQDYSIAINSIRGESWRYESKNLHQQDKKLSRQPEARKTDP